MTPETAEALVKTLGGGGTTSAIVLLALWLYNKKNGSTKTKYVSEGVCKLHQESLQKDITHMKESLVRVERLVRNGQKDSG